MRALRYLWALPYTAIGLLVAGAALLAGGQARAVDGVLEACGRLPAFVLRRLPLTGGAAAITLGHVVLGVDEAALDRTRRHEREHVRQYEVWGPLFLPAYAIASVWAHFARAGAYRGNRFERQAFAKERDERAA